MSDFQMPQYDDEEPTRRNRDFDDFHSLQEFVNSLDPMRRDFIDKLPTLSESQLEKLNQADSSCPICYNTFGAIIAEAELASAMDTPAVAAQHLGVTRLVDSCGHVFCRKDITTWIERNDRCPTCRTPFYEAPVLREDGRPVLQGSRSVLQGSDMGNFVQPGFNEFLNRIRNAQGDTDPAPATPPASTISDSNGAETQVGARTTNASPDTRSTNTYSSINTTNSTTTQRPTEDEELARMYERAGNLGEAMALSDIMFGLSALAERSTRRLQERDDDRNEYAGLYS